MEEKRKDILLRIKSVQKTKDEEPIELDLFTEGGYIERNGAIFLTYHETELTGSDNKVVMRAKDNVLHLNRYGNLESRMVFEKGKRETSIYKTPYGEFKIEVLTEDVAMDVCYEYGKINVDYTVSISGTPEIRHSLSVVY